MATELSGGSKLQDAVDRAQSNGHIMRDTKVGDPVAPGVFAECVECSATLRVHNGRMSGEAYYSWCPEAAPVQEQQLDTERDKRLQAYETFTLTDWATTINRWAEGKGWNEELHPNGDHFGDLIALMHSELSEALEEWRNGHAVGAIRFEVDKYGNPKPEGVPVELIDCVIRILHVLAYFGVDANHIMQTKHEYNITRPYRHGNKRS
jgi:hypothetical protein